MNLNSPGISATFALAAVSYLCAQDAMEILRSTAETYRNLTNYHFELETETETVSELSQIRLRERLKLAANDSGKVHAEFRHPGSWRLTIFDGTTTWQFDPGFREFARNEVSHPEEDYALRALQSTLHDHLGRVDKGVISARILREEPLQIEDKTRLCWVIRAEYGPGDRHALSKQDIRTYWIDRSRKVLLREERRSHGSSIGSESYQDQQRSSTTVYRIARINELPPESVFTFQPPADAVELGSLPSPGRRRENLRGRRAPDLSLDTLSGQKLTLSSLRGKVVLLDFWSSTCGACRAQMPELKALYEETKNLDVAFVGVNGDEHKQQAIDYVKQYGGTWPNLWDGKNQAWLQYRIHAQPTVVVIDREGIVFEQAIGLGKQTDQSIRSALRRLGIKVR